MKTLTTLLIVGCTLGLTSVLAEGMKDNSSQTATTEQHVALNSADLKWLDAPPSLPPGAKFAVIQGDPGKKGAYTVRLMVPNGYSIPPHTHPTTENVTVISGAMSFGMGDKFDESAGKKIEAGGFASMPAGMKHFAWAAGDTVVQVHGTGPFKIKYCHPGDDPRHVTK